MRPAHEPPRGWYRSRNLPHYDQLHQVQAITYRLSDSLPGHVIDRMMGDKEQRRLIERELDAGHGSCCLRSAVLAQVVVDGWRRNHGVRYDLIAWVVMPNHVHVMIAMHHGSPLSTIVQSWKSYSGKAIAAANDGRVRWQRDYWDRYIRDADHFARAVQYIHDNPVRANLCRKPSEWRWSSAGA